MSYHRSLANNQSEQSRDPRQRDRSRSDIRRPDDTDTFSLSASVTANQPAKQEQTPPTNGVLDFFKTLGLNSQLIEALINANPPKIEEVQPQQQTIVNNAQDFASFLSTSYGLDPPIISTSNQSINRDPRRRQTSAQPIPSTPIDTSSGFDRPKDPRLNSMISNNTLLNVSNNSTSSISIDDSYKEYISSIDLSLLDDETRKRFQRIALLDNELDKLQRLNIELTKTSNHRSRRRISTKDKDPLLKENENLQNELLDYIKTSKTTMMNNYPISMFNNIGR